MSNNEVDNIAESPYGFLDDAYRWRRVLEADGMPELGETVWHEALLTARTRFDLDDFDVEFVAMQVHEDCSRMRNDLDALTGEQ